MKSIEGQRLKQSKRWISLSQFAHCELLLCSDCIFGLFVCKIKKVFIYELMNLPSFIWLWKIAAWSMGCVIVAYFLLAVSGVLIVAKRQQHQIAAFGIRLLHVVTGSVMIALALLLLGIGIVGTLGHFGSLGHSWHLPAGLAVVSLVFLSAWSAMQINLMQPWARFLHVSTNLLLLIGLVWVSFTGWDVVQKYLP